MLIEQISVFLENKVGRLSEIVGILAANNVDIRALSIADTTDFGILRLIVDRPDAAIISLRAEGVTVSETKVIGVRLHDRPGSLAGVLKILHDNEISVEYAYAFITRNTDKACVVLRVEDNDGAVRVLTENNIGLLKQID